MSLTHGSPTMLQPPRSRHRPESQLELQQSAFSLQTSPSTRHSPPREQRMSPPPKSMQLRLQHALLPPAAQSSPAVRHPLARQRLVPPTSQSFEQQSLSAEHRSPSLRQRAATQTPPLHPSEQQSDAVVHGSLSAVQDERPAWHVNVPVPLSSHTPEQHVAPVEHIVPG